MPKNLAGNAGLEEVAAVAPESFDDGLMLSRREQGFREVVGWNTAPAS